MSNFDPPRTAPHDPWTDDVAPDVNMAGDADLALAPGAAYRGRDELLYELARDALVEKRRARRWTLFFRFFWCLLGILLLAALLSSWANGARVGRHTALLDINGVIADGQPASADNIAGALETALKQSGSVGVLLRINSPGGSPVQSGRVYDEILRLRSVFPDKPIHAVISDVGASGAYYIASAADNIYADKASIVGSIGVRMDAFGLTDALQKLGVEHRLVTAGENKALLDPFQPEQPAHRAHLEGVLTSIHQQFIDAVKRGRGDRLVENDDIFSGLIWNGEQALELGLVDQLADAPTIAADVFGESNTINYTFQQHWLERAFAQIGVKLGNLLAADSGRLLQPPVSPQTIAQPASVWMLQYQPR